MFLLHHSLTFLSLLLQRPTFASLSDISPICSAFEESTSPPIISVFHYPPTASIVFLFRNNLVQSVPVSQFSASAGTLSLQNTFPVKIVSNSELRCCPEPPIVQYDYMETLPQTCTDSDRLRIHYQLSVKQGHLVDGKPIFWSRDLYMERPPEGGKKKQLTIIERPKGETLAAVSDPVIDSFCPMGQLCSLITDPVSCEGYHFYKNAHNRVFVKDLTINLEAHKYVLVSPKKGATHLELLKADTAEPDLFSGELPLGFMLNKTAVLFNLRSEEVFLVHYRPVSAYDIVPIVGRSSLTQFFQCDDSGLSGNATGEPEWLAFQLSALFALMALLAIFISLGVVMLRGLACCPRDSKTVNKIALAPALTAGGGETTVNTPQQSSQFEGGGGGRGNTRRQASTKSTSSKEGRRRMKVVAMLLDTSSEKKTVVAGGSRVAEKRKRKGAQ